MNLTITSNKLNLMQSSKSSSTLSNNDRSFIEFARCLYKTKSVVQELQAFSNTVKPTLSPQNYQNDPTISTDDLVLYVNQYLEESFKKFNHMCKILLIVLTKLESNQPVRRERIDSFRQEVILEWRKVINVRRDLSILLQKNQENKKLPSLTLTPNSSSNSLIESDDDSDTTLEPPTSDSSSST